jgi:hypothetical protein
LREELWPQYREYWAPVSVWGDREERKAIRTYLRIVWQENNRGSIVNGTNNRVGVENEKDSILKVS